MWGLGYFKPPGESLSRKPRDVASPRWVSGSAMVPRANCQRSRGQWLRGDSMTTTASIWAKTEQAPGVLADMPLKRSYPRGYVHIKLQPLLSLTAEQQKRVSPFFFCPPFSLRACCFTKPLVTLDFSSSFCTKHSTITK